MSDRELTQLLSRRQALGLLAGVGLGVVAAACGGDSSSSSSSSSTSTTGSSSGTTGTTASSNAVSCVLTPEATEGPYYLDLDMVRSDITEGRAGTPLDLRITVVDADTCNTISDAAVDVWHCDAEGIYSGFVAASTGAAGGGGPGGQQSSPDDTTFLRGTQVTDANGLAQFRTIYPGWYTGRAVHIHMKVHVGGSEVHTGQLFFADTLSDTVYQSSPYSSKGEPDVRNSEDNIYSSAGAASAELAMQRSGDGYTGEITVGVRAS